MASSHIQYHDMTLYDDITYDISWHGMTSHILISWHDKECRN